MKSSWLRDALSEIDTSCDYVTIICNPPQRVTGAGEGRSGGTASPIFRIEAKSTRGTVEVGSLSLREYVS